MAVELFMLEGRDTALETALAMHVQKLAAAKERFKPHDLLLRALRLAKQEEWEAAAGILKGIPLEHLPYKLAAAAELQLIHVLRLSKNGAYLQQLARLDRLKESCVSDWELQYAVRHALAEGYQAQGKLHPKGDFVLPWMLSCQLNNHQSHVIPIGALIREGFDIG